jgi:ankyrin repeat protein
MKDYVDIIVGLTALIAVFYRAFQIEAAIYDAIDDLEKRVSDRINSIERSLALHIAIYAERKEQVDYLLHANEEKIDHKANRLLDEIKELKLQLKYKQKVDEGA